MKSFCSKNAIMKKKRVISMFVSFFLLVSMVIYSPKKVLAETIDQNNGDWNQPFVVLKDTSEADLMIRVGDIDNFGFEMLDKLNEPLNPFTGMEVKAHDMSFVRESDDPTGTDQIMVQSGFKYGNGGDLYAMYNKGDKKETPLNVAQWIHFDYREYLEGINVENAFIQMYVDGYGALEEASDNQEEKLGRFKAEITAEINGVEVTEVIPELHNIINNMKQDEFKGDLISFQIPERCLYMLQNGDFSIRIDDDNPESFGNGHAIDFAKVLINQREMNHKGAISGRVFNRFEEPLKGATVVAGGMRATTDPYGRFIIEGVPAGAVVITAYKDGYYTDMQPIELLKEEEYEKDLFLNDRDEIVTPSISITPEIETSDDVQVTIDYHDEECKGVSEYRVDGGSWRSYHDSFAISENCLIEARYIDEDYNFSALAQKDVTNLKRADIEISVFDVKGSKGKYEVDGNEKRYDYIMETSKEIIGTGRADIKLTGREVDFFRYKFINSSKVPTSLPEASWSEIDIYEDNTILDVVTDKPGFLNQRAYDVFHMPQFDKNDKNSLTKEQIREEWKKREVVYKYPFSGTEHKSARRAESVEEYGKLEKYISNSGNSGERWISNTVFMKHMTIDNEYREASKFWGYLKAPQTGEYMFGLKSDDGSKGIITVDGESVIFTDMFKPQGSRFGTSNKRLRLQKDKYYPIYIQYFNWGGEASFEFKYVINPPKTNWSPIDGRYANASFQIVPSTWLYPSVDISPGEHATSIFTGAKGVKFPKESGDYYIAYRTGKGDSTTREGLFGTFTVNGETDIEVSKYVKNGNMAQANEQVELVYDINPMDVKARSTFKDEQGNYKQTVTISDVKIEDAFDEGIALHVDSKNNDIVVNGNSIIMKLKDITFNLVEEDGQSYYTTDRIKVSLNISSDKKGIFDLSIENESKITFTDLNEAKRQLSFNSLELNVIERSEIITDISRDFGVRPTAGAAHEMEYVFNGEEVSFNSNDESIQFEKLYYEELFPPRIEILEYPEGMTKEGTFQTGYILKGDVANVKLERVDESNKYRVSGGFKVKLKSEYPKTYDFNKGNLTYKVSGNVKGNALSNSGELVVLGKLLSELNVLEIQPERDFQLTEDMFSDIITPDGVVNIYSMSMEEYIGKIEQVNGLYDIVYIGTNDTRGNVYMNLGRKSTKLPQGDRDAANTVEYFNDLDITNRNAEGIKEFIETNQLTIFAHDLFQNEKTKLYSNFHGYRERNNVVMLDNVANLKSILKEKYDQCNKRPLLEVTGAPKNYVGTEESYSDKNNMNFIFDIENLNMVNVNENAMYVSLYLDINGDGFFREDEKVKVGQPKRNGKGYSLNYDVKEYFVGMMPWKLQIEDSSNGAKVYKVGYPAYKGEKLRVRVLHLVPSKGSSLNITNNGNIFKPELETDQYKIEVTELSVEKFDQNYPNDVVYNGKTIKTELNGNYDMIILGFEDVYNGSDIRRIATDENGKVYIPPIVAIKDFIRTKQSVMFTHDTMMFEVEKTSGPCVNLTKEFRDIIGQSIYKDPNNPSEMGVFGEKIIHDKSPVEGKKTYGYTRHALKRAERGGFPRYKSAFRINESVMTMYPYSIGEVLDVAETHYQYFQLNLEDPDVVPWYNLNTNSKRQYDSKNFYHTYSKGNITYSGTGHTAPKGIEEQRLFVNTMLKASRNANHAPIVEVINLSDGKVIPKSLGEIEFSFIPKDIDGDKLGGNIYVNDTKVEDYAVGILKNGEEVHVKITKGILLQATDEAEEFEITLNVMDENGALESKVFNVVYSDIPTLSVSGESANGYLVGDSGSFSVEIKGIRGSENADTTIQNIEYKMTVDGDSVDGLGEESWSGIKDIDFSSEDFSKVQRKDFDFTVTKRGSTKITSVIGYEYSNKDLAKGTVKYEQIISARLGELRVRVQNSDGSNFGSAKVRITGPDGVSFDRETDSNGQLEITGVRSGEYSVELIEIDPVRYSINGGKVQSIILSYNNSIGEINFKLIDKSYVAFELTGEADREFLVGDKVKVTLTAQAYNMDEDVTTELRNFRHNLIYDEEYLEVVDADETWNIANMKIQGNNITNSPQKKEYNLKIKKLGVDQEENYSFINSLEYTYFGDMKGMDNIENTFSVKSGKIQVQLNDPLGRVCEKFEVIIKNKADGSIYKKGDTNELGVFTAENVPTGEYVVYIPDIFEFTAHGLSEKEVSISYDNPLEKIQFNILTNTIVINSGLFIDNRFVGVSEDPNGTDGEIVTGFKGDIATEFKVLKRQPTIKLNFDEIVEYSNIKLQRFNAYGQLVEVKGDIVLTNEDGSLNITLNENNTLVDLKGITGEKTFKLVLPESDTMYNHYVLLHHVNQNAAVGTDMDYTIKINESEDVDRKMKIVELPELD